MSPTDQLNAYAQSINLVIKNRYYDDLTSAAGKTYLNQVIDHTNQLLDELETTTNPDGSPVDWVWARQLGFTLGAATAGASSIPLDTKAVLNVIPGEERYVQILQDGTAVGNFVVVAPEDITNQLDRVTEDMCSMVGSNLVFSRVFKDYEVGGTIVGDITAPIPRMTLTNVKALNQVKPKQLLILGVAKNITLPDIVRGKLSPNYAQKFDNLLQAAIARNNASARSDIIDAEDYSGIGGLF